MNNSSPEQHDNRLSEELVAYLDGELSHSESESVEARIRQDDRARSELQRFDRVWNALDNLERPTVGDSFTRTTIEMATVEAKKELAHETAMLPMRKRRRWIKIASLATVAALVGFATLAALMPNANRQLYVNLPVIMELDAYSEVRDIDFLRQLDQTSGDWLLAEWEDEVAPRAQALLDQSGASLRERQRYVDSLDAESQADLAGKHRRYQSLTPEMRDELTDWHTRLTNDVDAKELQEVMLAYYAWVSQADEIDQARLRSLDAAARVRRVEDMKRRADARSEWQLSPANAAALRGALDDMADDPQLERQRRKLVDDLMDKWEVPENRRDRFKLPSPRISIKMAMGSAFGDPPAEIVEYRNAIEERLIDALDEPTAGRLRGLPARDRSRRVATWLRMAMRQPQTPDVATLEKFFVSGDFTPDEQQRLLAMPTDQMLDELENMYIREFVGEGGDEREFQRMFGHGNRFGRRPWDERESRPERRGPRGPGDVDGPDGPGKPPRGERPPRSRRPDDEGPRPRGERRPVDRFPEDGLPRRPPN